MTKYSVTSTSTEDEAKQQNIQFLLFRIVVTVAGHLHPVDRRSPLRIVSVTCDCPAAA